ncbi:MAG: ParB/RepB/Spo0J family partition protein [Elusimicrobiota bacterium]|jgi:ParB family chromosome partitioning protein
MRQALGKGLEALLPRKGGTPTAHAPAHAKDAPTAESTSKVPIGDVRPNRHQPRHSFDQTKLAEMAQTIKEHGLAQPILVTPLPDGKYELVAGERRLRAAKLAGLKEIDVVVRKQMGEKDRLALALIENVQRDDLNAVDVARAYRNLIQDHGLTQTDLAHQMGKSKSAVSNTLRLLDLSEDILKALETDQITEGHARALLGVSDRVKRTRLFHSILERNLSVREVETLARVMETGQVEAQHAPNKRTPMTKPAEVREIERKLAHSLGMKVDLRTKKDGKSGAVVIHFYNLNDFEKLMGKLK